jgi:hypothetical protein
MSKKEIIKKLNTELPILKSKYNVNKIGVFGSFARGDYKKGSDIDILVEFKEPIGFFEFIQLENYLSKKLRKKVDLITKRALKTIIKNDILKEVIYV